MSEERCKRYSDCTLEELADIVQDLENMSHAAKKPDMHKLVLEAVKAVSYTHLTLPTNREV